MHALTNAQLSVDLLDPVADADKLGARYCWGGYVYQVTDATRGPLLSGPSYPGAFNPFDGQGIPDAFNLSPLRVVGDPDTALIPGVGLCQLDANYRKNSVLKPATWTLTRDAAANALVFETAHSHGPWALTLQRVVTLAARTVRSATMVVNSGGEAIPLRWFPHPFYPQLADNAQLIKLNMPVQMPGARAYAIDAAGWITRTQWPWSLSGQYQALDHAGDHPVVIQQRHPLLGMVSATLSYAPDFFPIWGNLNTFSWEPFLERMIAPGQRYGWHIDYDF